MIYEYLRALPNEQKIRKEEAEKYEMEIKMLQEKLFAMQEHVRKQEEYTQHLLQQIFLKIKQQPSFLRGICNTCVTQFVNWLLNKKTCNYGEIRLF